MKAFSLFLLAVCAIPTWGRWVTIPSLEELRENADVVVLATPLHTVGTDSERAFQEIGNPIPLLGSVERTTFRVLVTFKGSLIEPEFILDHLQENPNWDGRTKMISMIDGPGYLSFEEGTGHPYLLFLKREKDRFVPLSGFTDPRYSIFKLDDGSPDVPKPEFPTVNFHPDDPFKP